MWRHVRAALMLVVIVAAIVEGMPTPRSSESRDQLANVVGDDLAGAAYDLEGARRRASRLFAPVFDAGRLREYWTLFSSAPREVDRLRIEVRAADGTWRPLYIAGDPHHTFLAGRLRYRRLRGVLNPSNRGDARGGFDALVDWIARAAFAQEPEADAVRVRVERVAVRPRGGAADSGVDLLVEIRRRGAEP